MTTEETYNEITATLGEDLKWMARKVEAKWPTLEPEILLLNWLCYRNGVSPPSQPILKRPLRPHPPPISGGVKTTWAEELQLRPLLPEVTVAVGRSPPRATTPRAPSALGRVSRPGSAARPGSTARSMRPIAADAKGWPSVQAKSPETATPPSTCCASTISSPEMRMQSTSTSRGEVASPDPPTPTSAMRFMNALNAAEAKLPDPAPRCSSALSTYYDAPGAAFSLPRPEPVEPALKSLAVLFHKVDTDASRHFGRSDLVYARDCRLTNAAMDRRYEERLAFLEKCPLFSLDVISRDEQGALVRSLRMTTFSRHDCLLAEGEISQRIIIIERGECDVVRGGDIVSQPRPGGFYGEASLVFDVPSKVAVVAASEVRALWLSREDIAAVVKGGSLFRLRAAVRARLCADVPLLADLTPSQQARIAERMRSEHWRKGSTLLGPLHASPRLFIIEDGECKVVDKDHRDLLTSTKRSMESTQNLRNLLLKPGHFFGMEGLLYSSEMGCHVLANSEDVKTLSISYEEILESCDPDERREVASVMHSSMQVFLLRQVPQLRNLSNESFDTVRTQVEEVLYKPWAAVVARGSLLDTIYVLKSGKVVEHDGDVGGLRDLSKLQANRPESVTPGDCFWSVGLVDANAKARTTLVALTHTSMLKIQRTAVTPILQEVCERLDRVPPFQIAALSTAEQLSLASQLRAWHFAPNRTIIVEGELGERLFIVESGVCDIIQTINGKEKVVGQLGRGAHFGELSIFFDEPRKMTVRSVTEATLLTLRREDLAAALPPAKLERVQSAALSLCMRSIPLLSRLDAYLRQLVAQRFQRQTWKAGDIIQRRLLPCQNLYFIESGTCLATSSETSQSSRLVHLLGESELPAISSRQEDQSMTLLGPGQYFGMRGFLTSASLGFAVTAESTVVRTSCISYEALISAAGPEHVKNLQRQLQEALRAHFLRQLPPLQDLEDEQILALVYAHCRELTYEEGEVIVPKGAPCDAFLILESGKVTEHSASPEEVHNMWWEGNQHSCPGACFPPGSSYKEISSGNHVSNFSLIAESSCNLLRVPLDPLGSPLRKP